MTAPELLIDAADAIDAHDHLEVARTMALATRMFNARYGTALTEAQGWYLMVCLTTAEIEHGINSIDDNLAYTALHAECVLNTPPDDRPIMLRPQSI